MIKAILLLAACLSLSPCSLEAQGKPPKREFRGAWVATVKNIDFPRRPTADPESLKAEYRLLLDSFKRLGLNALIFQVRPSGDAFYHSRLAPWSAFLTGSQGLAPDEDFDPLAFFIEEAHRRGMEFHAWLNPFRATMDLDTLNLSPRHLFHQHRNWMVRYGSQFYFNPALPEVRAHLVEVVSELVEKYDLDAIHLDDYFYPYKIPGETFPDSLDFFRQGYGFSDIDDWRRSNTDQLVRDLSLAIHSLNPHVRFGISPFGVWRNADRDPEGSPTRAGATCYDDLSADVRKWLIQGWIDYVIPQLYWHIGFEIADHQALLDWWSRNSFGRQLYVGHAVYKVGNNGEKAWHIPSEIPRQIELSRQNAASSGSAFFRAENLFRNPLGIADSLQREFRYPALIPESVGPKRSLPQAPELKKARRKKNGVLLKWRLRKENKENPPSYYVLYRFEAREAGNFSDPRNIRLVTPIGTNGDKFEFTDDSVQPETLYIYALTAFNRYHAESRPSSAQFVRTRKITPSRIPAAP